MKKKKFIEIGRVVASMIAQWRRKTWRETEMLDVDFVRIFLVLRFIIYMMMMPQDFLEKSSSGCPIPCGLGK